VIKAHIKQSANFKIDGKINFNNPELLRFATVTPSVRVIPLKNGCVEN